MEVLPYISTFTCCNVSNNSNKICLRSLSYKTLIKRKIFVSNFWKKDNMFHDFCSFLKLPFGTNIPSDLPLRMRTIPSGN